MTHAHWTPAYIGIGSNLDDPQAQVRRGIEALGTITQTHVVAQSHLYRTPPMGPQPQPDFINAAVGIVTQLDAATLLAKLQVLETSLGRSQPIVKWGPRRIDFDLLVFGSAKIEQEQLTVPHPGVAERAFVLVPMLDIAPDLDVPGVGRVRELAQRVDASGVVRV